MYARKYAVPDVCLKVLVSPADNRRIICKYSYHITTDKLCDNSYCHSNSYRNKNRVASGRRCPVVLPRTDILGGKG